MAEVNYMPEGKTTVTAHLCIDGCDKAMAWYADVFGAKELFRVPGPGGRLVHAEISIGNSHIMLVDSFPQWEMKDPKALGGSATVLHLYVEDTDAQFERAVAAGAEAVQEPNDAFWGDRFAKIKDPFGHEWTIGTHQREVSAEEMDKAMQEWMTSEGAEGHE